MFATRLPDESPVLHEGPRFDRAAGSPWVGWMLTTDQLIELEILARDELARLQTEATEAKGDAEAVAPDNAIGRLSRLDSMQMQEMAWNQRKGLCCGAGGGHAFMEVNIGRRVNHIRTEQAMETGASVVATGCPFCMQMFEDGVRSKGVEDSMRVHDIAELIAQSLPAQGNDPSPANGSEAPS